VGKSTGRVTIVLRAAFALALAAALWAGAPALAFHSGGVGACDGCHTMHNSFENRAMAPTLPLLTSGPYLLQGPDASSACLHCHQQAGDLLPNAHHVSTADGDMPTGTPPRQLAPAGDFGWLKKTYTWQLVPGGPMLTSRGERHGHNIVAADYGYVEDVAHPTAPGGDYPSARLGCHSCHDPHGKYRRFADGSIATSGQPIMASGSYADSPDPTSALAVGVYRHLAGVGYQPKSLGAHAFVFPPPAAVAPRDYNRSEAVTQTRVAYGSGMSEWCGNCHARVLDGTFVSGETGHVHPADDDADLTTSVVANYDAYVATGDLGGSHARSYLSLVPFEEGTADYALLKAHARNDDSFLEGPSVYSNVSCLSCHRSHASGFDSKTRYGHGSEFMTLGDGAGVPSWPDPATSPAIAQGRTPEEIQQAYYGRAPTVFAPYQRDLCDKCHLKD